MRGTHHDILLYKDACFIDRIKIRAEALLPGQLELPVVIGTVSQIEVDQGLIGDAFCVGQRLEVVDGAAVDVDGDLLFQSVHVGVFSWIQRIGAT